MRTVRRTHVRLTPLPSLLLVLMVGMLIGLPGCGGHGFGGSSGGGTSSGAVMPQDVADGIDTIDKQVSQVNATYEVDGCVPADHVGDALDDVAQAAQSWKQDGTIASYELTDDAIGLTMPDGVLYVYAPMQEDALGGTGEFDTDESLGIVTLEPVRGDFPDSCTPYLDMTDQSAAMIAGLSDQWSWTGYDQQEVTLDLLSRVLGKDGIYLWKGHGGYLQSVGPILCTSEAADSGRMQRDSSYYKMFASNELVILGGTSNGIGICSGYVRERLHGLDGSIVLLDTCHSAHDDRLSDAFCDRGAMAVLGFDDTVTVSYASQVMHTVFERFCTADDTTGEYPMLSDAVEDARRDCGETDPTYGTRLILSGTSEGLSSHIVSSVEVELPAVSTPGSTIDLPYSWDDPATLYADVLRQGTYGYVAFCDLNQDGVPELLASAGNDGQSSQAGLYYARGADLYAIAPDGAPFVIGSVNGMDHISWSRTYAALRQSWGGGGSVQYITYEFDDLTLTERTYSANDDSSYQLSPYTFVQGTFKPDGMGDYDYAPGDETAITRGDFASALKAWDADRAYVGFRPADSLSFSAGVTSSQPDGYTDDEIVARAWDYAARTYVDQPQHIEVDSHDGDTVTLHLYNLVTDDATTHTGTIDWLFVDRRTLEGTNIVGESVHL